MATILETVQAILQPLASGGSWPGVNTTEPLALDSAGIVRPFITFQRVVGSDNVSLGGPSATQQTRVQVDYFAPGLLRAAALARHLDRDDRVRPRRHRRPAREHDGRRRQVPALHDGGHVRFDEHAGRANPGSTLADGTVTWTAVSGMPSPLKLYAALFTINKGLRANSTVYARRCDQSHADRRRRRRHAPAPLPCTTAGTSAGSQPGTYLGSRARRSPTARRSSPSSAPVFDSNTGFPRA
jgi:hypothetical protein